MGSKIHRNSLKPGHKILWYEIKEILGQGGFGITYLAYDPNLKKNVAIKEYLPIELAIRESDQSVHPVSEERGKQYNWGLDRFITEAQTLAQFEHPNIVRVLSVTEVNNTAYMVMVYEHGQTLQEKLEGKKTLEESELLKIVIPILGGLEQIHNAGFIHRDIKPDNIFIRNDGSPLLLDFGSARQALGEQTKTLTSLVSPGYAPFEQYYSKSDQQGPWTDIYGLGATLYRAIAGVPPMDAVDRSNAILRSTSDKLVPATEIGKGKYSERFLKAIGHALQFKEEDRPQTIKEWKAEFDLPDDPIKEAVAIRNIDTRPGTKALERRQGKAWPFGKAALVGVIISLVISYYYRDEIQNYYRKPVEIEKQRLEEEKSLTALKQKEEKELKRKKEEQYQAELERQKQDDLHRQEAERLALEEETKRKHEEEKRQKEEKIQTLLSDAQEDIKALHLTSPEDNNALEKYNKILELDPESTEAKQGLKNIVDKYIRIAQQAADSKDYGNAFENFDKAAKILPDAESIKYARDEVELKKNLEEEQRLAEEEAKRKAEEERVVEMERKRKDELALQKAEQLAILEQKNKESTIQQSVKDETCFGITNNTWDIFNNENKKEVISFKFKDDLTVSILNTDEDYNLKWICNEESEKIRLRGFIGDLFYNGIFKFTRDKDRLDDINGVFGVYLIKQ